MDLMDFPRVGYCPTCGAELQRPEDDWTFDDDDIPHVIPGLDEPWCAACGWDGSEP